jgi:hypothetical protein
MRYYVPWYLLQRSPRYFPARTSQPSPLLVFGRRPH